MTREIKFNYWDGKQMKRADIIHVCDVEGKIVSRAWDGDLHEYFDLIEYTGLKDKNGKEIYEGDIIRQTSLLKSKHTTIDVIEWDRDGFVAKRGGRIGREIRTEIIGNIYENPELLEDKKE